MSKIFDKYFSPKIHYLKMDFKNNYYRCRIEIFTINVNVALKSTGKI